MTHIEAIEDICYAQTSTRRGADGWRTSLMVGRLTPNSTGLTTEERADAVHPEGAVEVLCSVWEGHT
ncbi:unnamed protein product [Boreogadus saida]